LGLRPTLGPFDHALEGLEEDPSVVLAMQEKRLALEVGARSPATEPPPGMEKPRKDYVVLRGFEGQLCYFDPIPDGNQVVRPDGRESGSVG
jgi:hypothetical protein